MTHGLRATITLLAGAALLGGLPVAAGAAPFIEWEMTPDLPGHVENPGGMLSASCIVHPDQTTFQELDVRITTPQGGILQEWAITDAMTFAFDWSIPDGYPDGIYRYEMDYISVEQGLTVSLSEGFLAAGSTTGVCAFKFNDEDGDGVFESENGETLLEGWHICATGPQNIPCHDTDQDGVTCWFFITPGTYEFCETQQEMWVSTTGECASVEVLPNAIQKVEFGNHRPTLPTQESSWSGIKSTYR
jgi:hypothetical protein